MTTILVVDDMAVYREPIAASLNLHGFETLCAANGREALQLLQRMRPDLMLLDLTMPDLDGLGVLRAIHADKSLPRCPIIILTGTASKQSVVEAAALGVKDYLLKSHFSLEYLLARIRKALEPSRSPAESETSKAHDAGAAVAEKPREDKLPTVVPSGSRTTSDSSHASDSSEGGAEQLKSYLPLLRRSDLNERLEGCGEMKALSPIVSEVLKLTSSDRASIDQVVKVIKRDQAIALKILKLANSSVYSRGDTVESLDQAVSRIGMGSIRQTVLNMTVLDQFGADKEFYGIHPLQFWEHSIACGLIAAEISRARNDKEPDLAFTAGLLHDIGRLVYIERLGDLYQEVFEVATRLQLPLERVESKLLLLNHADCMDRILHIWNFPKVLIDPIVFHHLSIGNMRRMASKRIAEVATLGLANRLTHALLMGFSGNEVIYPTEGLCQHLRLSEAFVHQLVDTTRGQTNDIKFTMLANANNMSWKDRRETWLNKLSEPFRPIYVSMLPEFDAYRIFCDQLRDRGDKPPNLIVMHVTHARDMAALTVKAKEAEDAAKVKGLPVIALSPNGDLCPPGLQTDGRPCRLLPVPITVVRLTDAIEQSLTGQTARPLAA